MFSGLTLPVGVAGRAKLDRESAASSSVEPLDVRRRQARTAHTEFKVGI